MNARSTGHSRRITLMQMQGSTCMHSFNEGEYIYSGIRGAIGDAEVAAKYPNAFDYRATHIAACVFPVGDEAPTRVVAKFPIVRRAS